MAFLAVVAALLGLTVAIYNKSLPWQATDRITLEADRVGNQLVVPADVKLDGVLVGRVSGVSTSGSFARLNLQIAKNRIDEIPADVVARILPKTLFGEKFVDLVIPTGTPADAPHLQAGDVIKQDRSSTALELQTVFNDLVPVLRALNPAQLSITLSNLATALRDRGDALGRNLALVNDYFTRFNKDLPNFNHDISALADLASNYADATPDLLKMLRNFSVNAHTITEKQDVYAQFLSGSSDFANTAANVFGQNADRLIQLANVSKPVLDLYAKYSVVLECLPNGLSIYDRTRLEQAFGQGPYLHITLTPVGDRGSYTKSDRPLKSDLTSLTLPPNCFGLPHGKNGLHPVYSRYPGDHPSDNYACAGYTAPPTCPTAPPGGAATSSSSRKNKTSAASLLPSVNTPGTVATPEEQGFVSTLLDPLLGGDGRKVPAGLTDLLVGPMLRGMAVSVS
ncbi:MAG TPA: MCE family protein [Mycobacteriales bacterium]|nr:MCE family protein [Mycobacteriales bacterium]